ncbi:SAM-dependent methyltransferase [Streptomyces sp. SID8381]|uniref:SAM-dependent methyltransferase n=1 Tax=unclassified Streptomyces TaxID=2593676 RepID=UPI0003740537|nr:MULTISPECIES: SAM-dependent methyltransferase [unclassified Streptomyces]MYX28589.1 SAM-dependent methyltransferase [Streptomyces sp. SID8381]
MDGNGGTREHEGDSGHGGHSDHGDHGSVVDLELDRAHSARMYDYFLGGITNFPADREAAGRAMAAFPTILIAARSNRAFMHRSTRYLARLGIEQFLDIGTGIPTSPNLHEVAQAVNPRARIIYTDNDPIVLAHARALLRSRPEGSTAYMQADVTDPDALLKHPVLSSAFDFDAPIALSLNALLHFITDRNDAHGIVERLKDALPSGSTLTISHVTPDFDPAAIARLTSVYEAAGTPGQARTLEEISAFFAGWDLLEPGLTPVLRWRPDPDEPHLNVTDAEAALYAGIARKP